MKNKSQITITLDAEGTCSVRVLQGDNCINVLGLLEYAKILLFSDEIEKVRKNGLNVQVSDKSVKIRKPTPLKGMK